MCTKISHLESIEIWKVSPQSFQLPPPLKWPHVKISWKKNLTPRDYVYKHCVSKPATYNKKKYEKCYPKVFNSPKTSPTPRMAPCENFKKKNVTTRDYVYKHCVSKSVTYQLKEIWKVSPQIFHHRHLPMPLKRLAWKFHEKN